MWSGLDQQPLTLCLVQGPSPGLCYKPDCPAVGVAELPAYLLEEVMLQPAPGLRVTGLLVEVVA